MYHTAVGPQDQWHVSCDFDSYLSVVKFVQYMMILSHLK